MLAIETHILPKRKVSQADTIFEDGEKLEKCVEDTKEIQIDIENSQVPSDKDQAERNTITDIFMKARQAYTSSWENIQVYIRSYNGTTWEEDEAYMSTIGDLNEKNLDDPLTKKKLVICDLARLEFCDDEIKEAVQFLETLSNEFTREELLKKTIECILDQRKVQPIPLPLPQSQTQEKEKEKADEEIIPLRKSTEEDRQEAPNVDVLIKITPPPIRLPPKDLSNQDEEDSNSDLDNSRKVVVLYKEDGRQNGEESPEKLKEAEKDEIKEETEVCSICYGDVPKSEFQTILQCSHKFCKPCYKEHITVWMSNNKVLSISCPGDNCAKVFEEEHVSKILDVQQFDRYKSLKKAALLNQNPNLRWCVRPGCDKYMLGKTNSKKVVCECGTKVCFKCGNEYHNGKSCQKVINTTFEKYARDKHVQYCPQCKSRIEKNGGCNHMTCARCKYQWCWLCGKKYAQNHYALGNPDRCRQLQDEWNEHNQPRRPVRNTYCKRMCHEPILFIAFPIFLVFLSIFVPQWLYSIHKKKQNENARLQFSGEAQFLFVLLGIVFFPISFVLIFFLIVTDGLVDFGLWVCKKVTKRDFSSQFRVLEPRVFDN